MKNSTCIDNNKFYNVIQIMIFFFKTSILIEQLSCRPLHVLFLDETHLSPPIWISSNFSQDPNTLPCRFWQVLCMDPPHAFIVLFRSSSATRPAQNMSLKREECSRTCISLNWSKASATAKITAPALEFPILV